MLHCTIALEQAKCFAGKETKFYNPNKPKGIKAEDEATLENIQDIYHKYNRMLLTMNWKGYSIVHQTFHLISSIWIYALTVSKLLIAYRRLIKLKTHMNPW